MTEANRDSAGVSLKAVASKLAFGPGLGSMGVRVGSARAPRNGVRSAACTGKVRNTTGLSFGAGRQLARKKAAPYRAPSEAAPPIFRCDSLPPHRGQRAACYLSGCSRQTKPGRPDSPPRQFRTDRPRRQAAQRHSTHLITPASAGLSSRAVSISLIECVTSHLEINISVLHGPDGSSQSGSFNDVFSAGKTDRTVG